MPLGDPEGGNFEYTTEGLPEGLFAAVVPVSDLDRSVGFYTGILGMEVLGRDECRAYLIRGGCRLVLEVSAGAGGCAGIFMSVDSPFNTRRRLADEGVEFASAPARGPMGTSVTILDPDGNRLSLIESGAEFRLRTSA